MSQSPPSIAIVTAGAGGMICGSCLNDNTLAMALTRMGVDAQLIPTYTPIRTDDRDVSIDRVFFGGINVFLEQKTRLWEYMPGMIRGWLNNPRLIRWLTAGKLKTDARLLGPLTLSMLRGEAGRQRSEVEQLVEWLSQDLRPGVVQLSNLLIAGFVPALKRVYNAPVIVCLQGDDIFLGRLPGNYRARVLEEMRRLDHSIDAYLVHSDYYADFMADYLSVPRAKFQRIPLGIQLDGFEIGERRAAGDIDRRSHPITIGYLARLAPEKGLSQLCDAFCQLKKKPGMPPVRLRVAGWLGEEHRAYAESAFQTVRDAGLGDSLEYVGEVDRRAKLDFLRGLDLFCVPSPYREPKGLYLLEALAAGVPVVVPHHGAFPQILAATGGGVTFSAGQTDDLVGRLVELIMDPEKRRDLGQTGFRGVRQHHSAAMMATAATDVYRRLTATPHA